MKRLFMLLGAVLLWCISVNAQGYRVANDMTYENGLRIIEIRSDWDEPVEFSVIAMSHSSYKQEKYRMIISTFSQDGSWSLSKGGVIKLWLGPNQKVTVIAEQDSTKDDVGPLTMAKALCGVLNDDVRSLMTQPIALVEVNDQKYMVGPDEARRVIDMFQLASKMIKNQ